MKILTLFGAIFAATVALAVPAGAGAAIDPSTYTMTANFSLTPKSASFYDNAFKSGEMKIETSARAAYPPNSIILPTRETTLNLPPSSQMTFNPPASMPVCPDSAIGPNVDVSVEIPVAVSRCPNSILGNGTAKFALAKNNVNPGLSRNGVVLAFNGGRVSGQPKVKFWAYSYETNTGVYTEGVVQSDGTWELPFPQLSQDSGLTDLNLNIPGKKLTIEYPQLERTVELPGGQAPDYVQAKCDTGFFPFSADFLLGQRDSSGEPFGETLFFEDVGNGSSCTGVPASAAKLGKLSIKGPSTAKVGKTASYSVTIPNTGGATATGVKLAVAGKGVKGSTLVAPIPGGQSKTVKISAKFKSKGNIKATFTATSSNAGKQRATKTITVK